MAKNFLTPIDMNSLEVLNFAVHNVSELPTAVNGRLVYHDGVLKFGYTSNSITQWTTLLDSARFSTSDYKTWSYISSYLNTNFYTKTNVDNLLTGYSLKGHTHIASNIEDWASAWDASFEGSTAVDERFLSHKYDNNVRVFNNPPTVELPLSSENLSSSSATGGTIYFNLTTGHILYKVGSTYYAGSFPDETRENQVRSPKQGDMVLLSSGTYVCTESPNTFVKISANAGTDLESWKTEVDNTLEILTGSSDSDGTINKWKELEAFLSGFSDSESEALKTQLDAKVAKGPNSGTSGFASATTYTPTLGTMTLSSRSAKAYRRITVDANGDLTSEMYKFIIDFTVDSKNVATYIQMTSAAFLNALSTTAGMNGFQELVVQTYKYNSDGSFSECLVDVRQDNAGVVLLFGTAPTSGTYRVIVMK